MSDDDVVSRAKAASDKFREACAASDDVLSLRFALAVEDVADLVPELVAELVDARAEIAGLRALYWEAAVAKEPKPQVGVLFEGREQ